MFKTFRKVKLPHRQPTEFERFRAFVAHEERQKARAGYETFAESNDFDVPDEMCPLERFFDTPTKYEQAGQFMEALVPVQGGFQIHEPDGKVHEFDSNGVYRKPAPDTPPARQDGQETIPRSGDRMEPQVPVDNSTA